LSSQQRNGDNTSKVSQTSIAPGEHPTYQPRAPAQRHRGTRADAVVEQSARGCHAHHLEFDVTDHQPRTGLGRDLARVDRQISAAWPASGPQKCR